MKASDLRDRTTEDLKELERSLADEGFQSEFKNFTNRLDDTSVIGKNRRDLARVKLILGERARGITVVSKPKPVPAQKAEQKAEKPAKKKAAPRAEASAATSQAEHAEHAAKPAKKAHAAPSGETPAELKAEKRSKSKPKSTDKTESK
jgi:large subunit ribosomal protein L29